MDSNKQFKTGDVVQLKSGGPKMTVGGYNNLGHVVCKWFAGTESKHGMFAQDSLEPANKNDTSFAIA
jgi:uncharacterized protein YodC (DUF2158 family)